MSNRKEEVARVSAGAKLQTVNENRNIVLAGPRQAFRIHANAVVRHARVAIVAAYPVTAGPVLAAARSAQRLTQPAADRITTWRSVPPAVRAADLPGAQQVSPEGTVTRCSVRVRGYLSSEFFLSGAGISGSGAPGFQSGKRSLFASNHFFISSTYSATFRSSVSPVSLSPILSRIS